MCSPVRLHQLFSDYLRIVVSGFITSGGIDHGISICCSRSNGGADKKAVETFPFPFPEVSLPSQSKRCGDEDHLLRWRL